MLFRTVFRLLFLKEARNSHHGNAFGTSPHQQQPQARGISNGCTLSMVVWMSLESVYILSKQLKRTEMERLLSACTALITPTVHPGLEAVC